MKKILVGVILIIALVMSFYVVLKKPELTPVNNIENNNLDLIHLDSDTTIAQNLCQERNLEGKVIVIKKNYCSACNIVVPLFEELEQELDMDFIFLNLSEKDDLERVKDEFGLAPHYTPTVLIGCKVYVGAYSKQEYETFIKNM